MRELLVHPDYQSINSRIESASGTIVEYLDECMLENGTFIDPDFGGKSDSSAISDYLGYVTDLMLSDEVSPAAYYASMQAFHFAYRAYHCTLAYRHQPIVRVPSYNEIVRDTLIGAQLRQVDVPTFVRDMMLHDSGAFLHDNPAAAALVDAYIDDIDLSGDYHDLAHTVAGLTFLQMELGEESRYVNARIAALEHDLAGDA